PEAYDKWLPVPYTTDEKIAKAFKVKPQDSSVLLTLVVRFHTKPGETVRKGRIQLELQDLSHNKGVCINAPAGADSPEALFFPSGKDGD
ncbi:hypothetical protein, partial [Streptomyces brasiliscabiei]|uniref:hypothetical protein n=1 Tax=Streptomyces brasiliscabiei TaxID=2736302 RepID=UPI0030149C75